MMMGYGGLNMILMILLGWFRFGHNYLFSATLQ